MHERISALLDGELDQSETEEILTLVTRNPDLSAKWQRYHLIRAAVRQESMTYVPEIAERMKPILFTEPLQEEHSPPRKPFFRPVGWWPGLALVASVAGLVAFSFLGTFPAEETTSALRPDAVASVDQATQWESATPDQEHTLNTFLVEHGEFAPVSSMNGLMAYAKFVSYDSAP